MNNVPREEWIETLINHQKELNVKRRSECGYFDHDRLDDITELACRKIFPILFSYSDSSILKYGIMSSHYSEEHKITAKTHMLSTINLNTCSDEELSNQLAKMLFHKAIQEAYVVVTDGESHWNYRSVLFYQPFIVCTLCNMQYKVTNTPEHDTTNRYGIMTRYGTVKNILKEK